MKYKNMRYKQFLSIALGLGVSVTIHVLPAENPVQDFNENKFDCIRERPLSARQQVLEASRLVAEARRRVADRQQAVDWQKGVLQDWQPNREWGGQKLRGKRKRRGNSDHKSQVQLWKAEFSRELYTERAALRNALDQFSKAIKQQNRVELELVAVEQQKKSAILFDVVEEPVLKKRRCRLEPE